MAYLYRKKRSPFWYVQFVDSDGKRRDRSTGLRADDPNETAKAKSLRAELESKEHLRSASARNDTWDTWVLKFLDRHCQTPRTHERYVGSWRWLSLWLSTKRVHSPRQLTYRMAVEYIDWRTGLKRKRGKTAGRNTAIMELKILALVMGEAVRLGFADANPLVSMKLRRDKPKKKPEMTDEEIVEIRRLLTDEPEWMQVSFEIALHTGCRLRETKIPADCLDFKEKRITFPSPKGGDARAFSIPMPSALEPVLKKIKKSGRSHTIEFPFQPSRRWQQFFIKIKKEHLCFHCLRVSYVNRLRRAGVPREAAMRMVNHSSELVHQIYQRESVADIVQWRDAVCIPS